MTTARSTQFGLNAVVKGRQAPATASQAGVEVAYGPPASKYVEATQRSAQIARSAGDELTQTQVSAASFQMAYKAGQPGLSRADCWTFVMDGHRFYVLPLGPEGTWAYDTTTKEWCQLQTQGFDGINFAHGVMWDVRVIGGDSINQTLLEMDPNQPLDDSFRPVEHIVTGGVASRGRHAIGVANFTLTASTGDDQSIAIPITLAFSDDNGVTWSQEFALPLTDVGSQLLIWNALGSYSAPGRVFRITDFAGPVRLDGADVVLTIGSGADSGIDDPE